MAKNIDNDIPLSKIEDIDSQNDDLDDVRRASDIYGEWGSLQRNVSLLFVFSYLVAAFQNIGVIFYLSPIDYHCKLPEGYEDRNVSKCFKYEGSAEKCSEWEFDHSFHMKTLIDEFELVCDREHYISMTKSIFQVGYLVASILIGWISDRYGRLVAFKFSIFVEILASLSQALSINIHHYLISRLFLGAYGGSLHVTIFIQAISTASVFIVMYFSVNRFPRKSVALFLGICAVCSIWAMMSFTFDSAHINYLTTIMFAVKFFCSGLFIVVHLIKSEISPTTLRQMSLGSCSVAQRIGSVLAPYSRELENLTHLSVLIGLYGVLAIVNEIHDTIEEALQLCEKKKTGQRRRIKHEL